MADSPERAIALVPEEEARLVARHLAHLARQLAAGLEEHLFARGLGFLMGVRSAGTDRGHLAWATVEGRTRLAEILSLLGRHPQCIRVLRGAPAAASPRVSSIALRSLPELPGPELYQRRGWLSVLLFDHIRRGETASFGRFVRSLQQHGHLDLVESIEGSPVAASLDPSDAALIRATSALWLRRSGDVRAALAAAPIRNCDRAESDLLWILADVLDGGNLAALLHEFQQRSDASRPLLDLAMRWETEILMRAGRFDDAESSLKAARDGAVMRLLHRIRDLAIKCDDAKINTDSEQHRFVLCQLQELGWFDPGGLPPDGGAEEQAFLWRLIDRFGGNRTDSCTTIEYGHLVSIPVKTPRQVVTSLQGDLQIRSVDSVLGSLAELALRHPMIPLFETYGAEILLWLGEYQRAEAIFSSAWEGTHTRWSYIGRGASRAFLGDEQEAFRIWDEGIALNRAALVGEASLAYRVEAMLQQGNLTNARQQAIQALTGRSTRLRTWISLAEINLRLGLQEPARVALLQAVALCPGIFLDIAAAAQRDLFETLAEPPAAWAAGVDGTLVEVCGELRRMMRGNASSWLYTWTGANGDLRAIARIPIHDLLRALAILTGA